MGGSGTCRSGCGCNSTVIQGVLPPSSCSFDYPEATLMSCSCFRVKCLIFKWPLNSHWRTITWNILKILTKKAYYNQSEHAKYWSFSYCDIYTAKSLKYAGIPRWLQKNENFVLDHSFSVTKLCNFIFQKKRTTTKNNNEYIRNASILP